MDAQGSNSKRLFKIFIAQRGNRIIYIYKSHNVTVSGNANVRQGFTGQRGLLS